MTELHSLRDMSHALAQGKVSSVELTQEHLDRVKTLDASLNSFITLTEDEALAHAAAADGLRAKGDSRPTLGLPMAHKDIFCINGVRTTAG